MNLEAFLAHVGLRGEPVAHPDAVIVHGETRFTVLTSRLVRIEWAPAGAFDDRPTYAFPSRRAPAPAFHLAVSGGALRIDTGELRIERSGLTGPHTAANLVIQLSVAGAPVEWRPGQADPFNLRGARRTLDGCRGEAALDPGILSRSGWALHDDSATVRFDPDTGWVLPRPEGPVQDYYFFGYGHAFKQALAEYARFGGAVPMIPRWALGAWWSRYWPYSEQEIRRLVAEFAEHDVPLDIFVIDMDWHLPGWTGYTWNRELLPDPHALLAWLRRQGLRVTLNLHPADGVGTHEAAHPAFAAALDADPSQPIPFRIADPRFTAAYFALLHHPLEDEGVDFWWMDWQQGQTSELAGLDPLPWLNHLHFQEMRRRPGRRPMVFSRWGGLGNHRYPIGFSGDTYATWEALRFQPYFTATAANVLYGWWSHDIGGHFDKSEPELYARWVQIGAFSPIMRLHSTNDPVAERRPWAFPPAVRDAARAAFKARYELLPYLYTLARVHADEGLAPARPLYYAWPDHESAYLAREQYALGDQLIVAPIIRPADPVSGLASVDVWVPPGSWVERSTGELLEGPRWTRLLGDLFSVPQLLRAGAILPLAPETSRSHQQPHDQLTLAVFPGEQGELRFYEDAGEGEEYRSGQCEWTPVRLQASDEGHSYALSVGPVEGYCHVLPETRAYTLRFEHVQPVSSVQLDGERLEVGWSYDAERHTLTVELPARRKDVPFSVTVTGVQPLARPGAQHNQALRRAEAARLLGLTDADPGAIWDAALAGASPAHRDALARAGGPFARVYEYTAPEDAGRALGALLVAAPHHEGPVEVSGVWRLVGAQGASEHPFDLGACRADTIVYAPFSWERAVAAGRWSLELCMRWRGVELREQFSSQVLFPTIGTWRSLAAPAEQPYALTELLDAQGAPLPELPWETHSHAPAHGEFQNLTERFNVPLQRYGYARAGSSLVGYAVAALRSPDARPVRIAYQSFGSVQLYLNGQELPSESFVRCDPLKINAEWSRSAVGQLRAGINHLLVVSPHDGVENPWRWILSAQLLDEHGEPASDVEVVAPESRV